MDDKGSRVGDAPLPKLTLPKRDSITVEIARELIEYTFRSGLVEPGSRLPSERKLADALGVGRSAIREALKSLNLLGLVDTRQGDGTYVRRPDSELLPQVIEWGLLLGERKVIELVEARQAIERSITRLAAERRTDEDLEALEELLGTMEASFGEPETFVDADVQFHLRLAQAAKNSVLSDVLSSVQSLLRVWIKRVIGTGTAYDISYEEHALILKAIRAGDAEAAEVAMADHMSRAGERLLETLEDQGSENTESADG